MLAKVWPQIEAMLDELGVSPGELFGIDRRRSMTDIEHREELEAMGFRRVPHHDNIYTYEGTCALAVWHHKTDGSTTLSAHSRK